jgi:hypothetical protein
MNILHKEGHSIAVWVYSDDGLPLYQVIVPSETVTTIAENQLKHGGKEKIVEIIRAETWIEVDSAQIYGIEEAADKILQTVVPGQQSPEQCLCKCPKPRPASVMEEVEFCVRCKLLRQ